MITLRIRSVMWFTAGLVLAVALVWGSLAWRAYAAPGASESTIVSVTPTRVLDTRDSVDLGLPGPFVSAVSQKLKVTGSIPVTGGTATVVPTGATGILLNVTVVSPKAAGFLSIRPGDATGAPSTSSLNFAVGQNVPNAVQVSLPTAGPNAGQIDIVYDASGVAGPTTEVLIDVVGYTTNKGIQELVADVALKANKADVAALAATHIFAAGRVSSSGVKSPLTSTELGNWSVARTAAGTFTLTLPGGCVGSDPKWPLVLLSLGFNEVSGEVALGTGSCPSTNVLTWTVSTRDSAGNAVDKNWSFMVIGPNSGLTAFGDEGAAPNECTASTEVPEACG